MIATRTAPITPDRLTLRRPTAADMQGFVDFFGTERSTMNGGPLLPGRAWRAFAAQLGARLDPDAATPPAEYRPQVWRHPNPTTATDPRGPQ
ncbi:hypothetical protein [Frigidibacter sp. ROC022]|uniref:hypothetical protein n=1 Tax=Frigidibacter sp. ROC022 TaxID=2971796 RepID=UPI00215A0EEC|nr:hypothetical protein [Frigidibacter sp. ROC022]MCR8724034.1 hypothetical protein [Frigidibacter sp. ROC022]